MIIILIIIIIIILIIILILVKYYNFKKLINTTKVFITFGGGGQNYIDAGKRLISQADSLKLFDKSILYTDEYLKNDEEFWTLHSNFIENNKRGYGYWLWKSYIIKKTMNTLKNGDILMYLDGGCEINLQNKSEINNYFIFVKNDYIINTLTGHSDRVYNKMDLVLKLNMNDELHLNTLQQQAGALLFLICDKTRNLVNEWYDISCNYHLIDDSPSINKNVDDFIEHRHDQAILSLLMKKYNFNSNKSLYNIINYARNRSGQSIL